MASARQTNDHDEIREWVESRNGHPAEVEGTGVLRIDFDPENSDLETLDWDRFFELFEESNLTFLYDPEGHMVKFIQREGTLPEGDGHTGSRGGGRKTGTRKSSARKSTARKKSTTGRKKSSEGRKKSTGGRKSTGTRKTGARKSSAKKSTAKKSTAKKSSAKKSTSRKSSAKKSGTKKSAAKKSGAKKSGGRKYGKKAQRKIGNVMHEYGEGKLRSGRAGRPVKNRKQAIAIGISEARREGDKVPRRKKSGGRKRKKS